MRALLFFLALFLSLQLNSQVESPKILEIETKETFWSGTIGDENFIMYVYLDAQANRLRSYELISGYLQINGQEDRIYYRGMYSGNDFVIFQTGDYEDTLYDILNRGDDIYNAHEDIDAWAIVTDSNFDLFEERWIYEKGRGQRQNTSRIELFSMHNFDRSALFFSRTFLEFPQGRYLDMTTLGGIRGIYHHGYEIVAWGDSAILLKFDYGSNPWNPMGRCGAGMELGLSEIIFDKERNPIAWQSWYLESCNNGIYAEYELRDSSLIIETFEPNQENQYQEIDLRKYDQSLELIMDSIRFEY